MYYTVGKKFAVWGELLQIPIRPRTDRKCGGDFGSLAWCQLPFLICLSADQVHFVMLSVDQVHFAIGSTRIMRSNAVQVMNVICITMASAAAELHAPEEVRQARPPARQHPGRGAAQPDPPIAIGPPLAPEPMHPHGWHTHCMHMDAHTCIQNHRYYRHPIHAYNWHKLLLQLSGIELT